MGRTHYYMIRMEQWRTTWDEHTCDQCKALDGQEFEEGKGPHPPLHPFCRCRRQFSGIKYVTEEPQP